ncbi:MAG: MFS transporter [Chloroflexota bacterium]|nr:MFS transporter [Chloroflexota bacterium]
MSLRGASGTTKLFFLSCVMFAMGGLHAGALGVVWIYVQSDFDLTLSALGVLVSVATVGRLLTSASSGPLINRFGIAPVLITGIGVTGASLLVFAAAPYWIIVLLAAFISGVGSGVMAAGINAFAAVNFSARQMNWLHGSFGIGSTIGPLIVTTIVIDLGLAWRWAYVMFAAMRAVILLGFFLTRKEWTLGEAKNKRGERVHASLGQTMRMPIVWLMVLTFMTTTGLELVAGQFSNNFLIDARLIDPKVAASWVSMYWASLTVSRFVAGFIIARIGNGMFLRLNSLGAVFGAVLLWAGISDASSLIGLALVGFCIAPFAPLMASDTPGRVGSRHVANAIGFQFTGASLGMAVLPWLAGTLAEAFGLEILPQFLVVVMAITFLLHEAMLLLEGRRPLATAT